MISKKLIVGKTDLREDTNGDFIAQIHPSEIFLSPLTRYIIVKNTIAEEEFKILVLLQTNDKVKKGKINLDMKIRIAIGVEEGQEVEVELPDWIELFKKVRILSKIFGRQVNILRVKYSSFSDMEIRLCRISDYVMKTIGIEEGDKVIVESSRSRISIKAFNLPDTMISDRKSKEKDKMSIYHNNPSNLSDKKRRDLLSNIRKTDLPWILLDNDVRHQLTVKTHDAVRVYRDSKYAIRKKIHLISIPLVLTVIGFVLSLEGIFNNFSKIMIYSIALLIVLYLNLLTIKIDLK